MSEADCVVVVGLPPNAIFVAASTAVLISASDVEGKLAIVIFLLTPPSLIYNSSVPAGLVFAANADTFILDIFTPF